MAKFIACCCLLLLHTLVHAQADKKVVIGTIDSVQSKVLNEQRYVWVYTPGTPGSPDPNKKYPVVYLLDGDVHFYSVVGLIHQLSTINGNNLSPEMIVVGIPNTDRTRDLTPSHEKGGMLDSNFTRTSGGGENFTSFLEKELIPYIDAKYPTTSYRTLIGHSFGGLMVINTLVHHTKLFNAYLAIDPSMWWDDKKLLQETKQALATRTFPGRSLFVGIANTMPAGMDTAKVQQDTSLASAHIRSILELNKCLAQNKQNQLRYMTRYYNDDDHGSVPLIAEYDAIRFFFDFYKLKLTPDDQMNTSLGTLAKIEKHYADLSKHFGYEVKLPMDMVAMIVQWAAENGHYETAERLLKKNIDNYPESNLPYKWLAIFYENKLEFSKALEYYKKAYAIKQTPDVKEKLEELK
jgi:predicted alpha/beta superfamily hydrolase